MEEDKNINKEEQELEEKDTVDDTALEDSGAEEKSVEDGEEVENESEDESKMESKDESEDEVVEEVIAEEEVAEGKSDDAKDEAEGESEEGTDEEDKEEEEEEDENFKWYAVRIISGHENKVKAYLDSEIKTEGFDDRIKNVLIPLEKVFEVKGGKKKVKYKNFLPGYMLIQANLDDKVRNFISQAPSIINMVGSKSVKGQKLDPVPLKGSEVKRITSVLKEEGEKEKIDINIFVGDPVKVTSGPFNNFNGNILEVNTEKMKVKVMVSIFGRKTPIELEFNQIEKEK